MYICKYMNTYTYIYLYDAFSFLPQKAIKRHSFLTLKAEIQAFLTDECQRGLRNVLPSVACGSHADVHKNISPANQLYAYMDTYVNICI